MGNLDSRFITGSVARRSEVIHPFYDELEVFYLDISKLCTVSSRSIQTGLRDYIIADGQHAGNDHVTLSIVRQKAFTRFRHGASRFEKVF